MKMHPENIQKTYENIQKCIKTYGNMSKRRTENIYKCAEKTYRKHMQYLTGQQ